MKIKKAMCSDNTGTIETCGYHAIEAIDLHLKCKLKLGLDYRQTLSSSMCSTERNKLRYMSREVKAIDVKSTLSPT